MTTQTITIGTRVSCVRHCGVRGTVFKIDGEQQPETVRISGGVMHSGGRAHFSIVFDNGRLSLSVPECIIRGVQWSILDELATPEQIAASLASAYLEQAQKRLAADNEKARFAAEVDRLRVDAVHSALDQGDDRWSGKLAAVNIRRELKSAFGKVKFSVRNRDHGSIDIGWTDGPTDDQVTAIVGKYQGGRFNGMEDIYEDTKSPWTQTFGGARYVFTNRACSAALIDDAIATVFRCYAGNFAGSGITADAEAYRSGKLWNVTIPHLGDNLETVIRSEASRIVR